MASNTASFEPGKQVEDVLAHLPISSITEYRKGQVVYGPDSPSKSIHLLVTGRMEISQRAEDGSDVLLEIVLPEELFGESALLTSPHATEQARAVVDATSHGLGRLRYRKSRYEASTPCGSVVADPVAAQCRVDPQDRELFNRHHREAPRPFADPLI